MQVTFIACDKGTSDGFTRSVNVETKEALFAAWKEFEKKVPFKRWYPDNTNDSENDKVDKWLEELEELEESLP